MEFISKKELEGPNGEHWFEGEVYTLTRRDLVALNDADLLSNFQPVGDGAQALFDEVGAMNNDQ